MHKISFIVVQNSSTHIPETIASIKSSPPNNMVQLFCPKKSVLLQLILMLPIIISAVKKSPRFLLNSPFYKLSPNKPPSLSIIFPDGYKGGDFELWILELTNESQARNICSLILLFFHLLLLQISELYWSVFFDYIM